MSEAKSKSIKDQLVSIVNHQLFTQGKVATEEEIWVSIAWAAQIFSNKLTDEDLQDVFDEISRKFDIQVDLGIVVQDKGHVPWLEQRRDEIDWERSNVYQEFLLTVEGLGQRVVANLNQDLDVILDHMGNPADDTPWDKRGLVIGNVQSGKTATYIGLMAKAADAGYRVIIVLTGNTENLRQQTQSRIDEGFIGKNSSDLASKKSKGAQSQKKPTAIGIGLLRDALKVSVHSRTTVDSDFKKTSLEASTLTLNDTIVTLFVSKKNKSILNMISEALDSLDKSGQKIHAPLLFIDDEADYASINTKKEDEDPTAINDAIRSILRQFSRSSYIGFTATPFANIFIADDDDDLFPKDFIYGLKPPSDYLGVISMFSDNLQGDTDYSGLNVLRGIHDAEGLFPLSHKSHHLVNDLPESLLESIRTYLVFVGIQRASGEAAKPFSMMINVSRYKSVQRQIHQHVEEALSRYVNSVRLYAKRVLEQGITNPDIDELHQTYLNEYGENNQDWESVLGELIGVAPQVMVRLVNTDGLKREKLTDPSAAKSQYQIQVGGDMLSRGLTLPGLAVSYFYRRTAASDTLLQMGRWFGYRHGYAEETRIWLSPGASSDFANTADSLVELDYELARMSAEGLTPKQYGLAVKTHPSALLITARNKMRQAVSSDTKSVSLRGRAIETSRVSSHEKDIKNNIEAVENLIASLGPEQQPGKQGGASWSMVDKTVIADFLDQFEPNSLIPVFERKLDRSSFLAEHVRTVTAADLQYWDVALRSGEGSSVDIAGKKRARVKRKFDASESAQEIYISGSKRRVAGRGDVGALLPPEVKRKIEEDYQSNENRKFENVPDKAYIYGLERPLLLIYPIEPSAVEGVNSKLAKRIEAETIFGISIATPVKADENGKKVFSEDKEDQVTYLLNPIAQKLRQLEFDVGEDDNDEVG